MGWRTIRVQPWRYDRLPRCKHPDRQANVSHLQVSSPTAIDAEIAESEKALHSKATLFIGGHGGATKADAVQFKIDYLKTMKKLLTENKTQEAFIEAMKKAYPNLPGADGLGELAKALYK